MARAFRWIGWIGIIVYLPMTLAMAGASIYSLFAKTKNPPPTAALLIGTGILFIAFAYLRTATGLVDRHPQARRGAIVLSCVLLLGFPLFTIIGGICIYKVRRYFGEYCEDAE